MNMSREPLSDADIRDISYSTRTRRAMELLDSPHVELSGATNTNGSQILGGSVPSTTASAIDVSVAPARNITGVSSNWTHVSRIDSTNYIPNTVSFGADKKIEFTNDGELLFTISPGKVINVNKLVDKVDRLESQMAAILDQQHKKISGKLLKSKINL